MIVSENIITFVRFLCAVVWGDCVTYNILNTKHLKISVKILLFLFCTALPLVDVVADDLRTDSVNVADSLKNFIALADSVPSDTIDISETVDNKPYIEAEVEYQAQDSIVLFADGTGYMYNQGKVIYKMNRPVELNAKYIKFKMDSSVVHAVGGVDSLGNPDGDPVFKEGTDEYKSKFMSYNFNTRRGYVRGIVTQQDESYIVADQTKMMEDNTVFMKGGKLTTCDEHDHPHFYMQLTKAKLEPNSYMAAGPAYFVLGDVPLPIAIPFGFFPFTNKNSSGIIMPTFGEEFDRGLFLKNGGFYWAINDYVDMEVLGELYTKGTWALTLNSRYVKRYKFNGNISISYREDVTGVKGLPDYTKAKNFRMSWRHQQDTKASQFSSFSASVDFTTSGYNKSNVNNYYNPLEQSKNITSSSVNYTQRFPESKWSLSVNGQLSQRTQDSSISVTLPSLTVNLSQTYPFKRKKPVGKERWYEKIYLSYTMTMNNKIDCKEDQFLTSNLLKDWKNGVKHTFNIGAAYTFFKHLNFNVGANGNWKWCFSKIDRDWDTAAQREVQDTTYGFYNVYDMNVSASMSTKLYGFYTPVRKWFGDKVDRIRHLMTPSIRFGYSPDLSEDKFGMYSTYEKLVYDRMSQQPISRETVKYSPYSHNIFGVPGQGMSSNLSFQIDNNVEMKIKDRNDSTGQTYKKVSIIDLFSLAWGYNFAADSLRWNNLTAKLRLKVTKGFTVNLSTAFDPYQWVYNDKGAIVHCNELHWDHGEPMHFTGFGTTFSYTFNNNTFKKNKTGNEPDPNSGDVEIDPTTGKPVDPNIEIDPSTGRPKYKFDQDEKKKKLNADADGYDKPEVDWSLSVSYTFNYKEQRTKDYYDEENHVYKLRYTHSMSINGSIRPTPKWNVAMNAYFDLTERKVTSFTISVDRDLHCWRMSASISPVGLYKSFLVSVGISANILKDVKYEKRSDSSSNASWLDKKR